MRKGFTTGSCAAAAAKAALYMLLTGREKRQIRIITPRGIAFTADITNIKRSEERVSCAVIKDGGDDPDVTTGYPITATVSFLKSGDGGRDGQIEIDGGEGVGRVTKPGLDQPVGAAAINHVPREMIRKEAQEVLDLTGTHRCVRIVISVPGGEELAKKTFNPKLGIVGGISILGTSGIVEPMSEQALLDTIRVELRQKKALGYPAAPVSPGNYGLEFMKRMYGYDLDRSVKCSNFIGDTIDMAAELGFSQMLLTGHIGKLVKVSGGILNTHSKVADCRMELLAASALLAGADGDTCRKMLGCVTTEDALDILTKAGILQPAMDVLMQRIQNVLDRKADGRIHISCILYSSTLGLLARSPDADRMLGMLLDFQKEQEAQS